MNSQLEEYAYDAYTGNLATKAGVGYTYDEEHPHAVASLSNGNEYGYDDNGNMIERLIDGDTYTLGYDAEGHLVTVTGPSLTASFVYDGDGARVKSTLNGEIVYFASGTYEFNDTTNEVSKYYMAGATRVAVRVLVVPSTNELTYLLGDHLGSTSLVTDDSGDLVMETRYKPWGEVRYATSNETLPTQYTYTGQYSYMADDATDLGDDGFGLMYYNARWYDPYITRWTQPDTIVPDQYNQHDWNRYAYARNNPLRYTDSSGHCIDGISTTLCIAALAGGIIGGIAGGVGYYVAQKITGQEVDYQDMGVAILGGVVVGALSPIIAVTAATAGGALVGTLALNGAVTSAQYIANQSLHEEPVVATELIEQAAVGTITGLIGGVYSPFDEMGREGMRNGLKLSVEFGEQTLAQFEKENAKGFIQHTVVNSALVGGVRTFAANTIKPHLDKLWDWLLHGH